MQGKGEMLPFRAKPEFDKFSIMWYNYVKMGGKGNG